MLASPEPPRRTTARIGVLTVGAIGSTLAGRGLLDGLEESGWTLGQNLRIEYRFAQSVENVAVTVAELASMQLDAIVAEGNNHVRALKAASVSIPIVMALCNDPVRTGLVASLARPGGNVTGVASLSTELTEKRLDLLKQTLPRATRVTCIWNPDVSGDAIEVASIHESGSKLGLVTEVRAIRSGQEARAEFAAASRDGVDAIVLLTDALSSGAALLWSSLVSSTRLPVMSGNVELVRAGTLMAYGTKIPDLFRRAAIYVDKILRGAKPADLPVEQPTEFDFVVNERVARAIGLTIPPSVLAQATEVIQ